MKTSELSNFQIEDICKRLTIPLAGIVSRDSKYPSCKGKLLVINLDSKEGPGTHWVGLIEFPDHYEYFDSFGVDCPEEVSAYCQGKKLLYQNEQMQSLSSENCGWFVILWALIRLSNQTDSIEYVYRTYINEKAVAYLKSKFSA